MRAPPGVRLGTRQAFLDLLDPPEAGGGGKKLGVAEGANFTFLKGATFVSAPTADAAVELRSRGKSATEAPRHAVV